MPLYQFSCKKCGETYDELCSYDSSGKYKGVKCPSCNSARKNKLFSSFTIVGTSSTNNVFDIKAGNLMEKAKKEREFAESKSHMGRNPYNHINDLSRDIGIHDA